VSAVVVEVAALALLVATGWWLLAGTRPRLRLAAALPTGVALLTTVELVLVATGLPVARPWIALLLAALVALGVAARRNGVVPGSDAGRVLAGGAAVGLLTVLVTSLVPLVNVTADSWRYLTVAGLLAREGGVATASSFLLETRGLATGVVHGLAAFDPGYLRAFGPLLAASTLALLAQLLGDVLAGLAPRERRWTALAAVALLATNHWFVYSAFYINGHLLFAAWLLLLVAVAWYRLRSPDDAQPRLGQDVAGLVAWPVAALAAVALTVLRPEGILVALLALAPLVVDPRPALAWRRRLLGATGLGVVVWHAVVLLPKDLLLDRPPPVSTVGLAGVGVALVVVAALLGPLDGRLGRRPLVVAHGLVWLALAGFTLADPWLLLNSLQATLRNVASAGAWGGSLLLLAGLLVIALPLRRVVDEQVWLFPLLTFVPLAALLGYLRDAPFREGAGDSLNRMLLHVLPLAVLALAATAASDPRRLPWSRRGTG
jgi:hypothetical protein